MALEAGGIGCPETSVRNYHSTLPNMPEERKSHCWIDVKGMEWEGVEWIHLALDKGKWWVVWTT